MSISYKTFGTLALKTCSNPELHLVKQGEDTRDSLYSYVAVQVFGHLHGMDFSSDVHEVLDGNRAFPAFLCRSERLFAIASSAIASCALFVLSFM